MAVPLIGGGSDLSSTIAATNNAIREINNREVTEIFKDDTGTRRVILGKRGDDYGLFVSKAGFDAFTAGDDDLVFNSNQNVFKIVSEGNVNITADNGGGTGVIGQVTITHNLGYIPAIFAFVDIGSVWIPLPAMTAGSAGATVIAFTEYVQVASITTTEVLFYFHKSTSGSTTYNLKYFLMQESVA